MMKQVIAGKLYNTETASELARWNNGFGGGDFRNCTEVLYITKKGSYFLAGYGGAMSQYASRSGDNSGSGSEIVLMTQREALGWCETRGIADVEDLFQDIVEEG